jgi:hypothetical protein
MFPGIYRQCIIIGAGENGILIVRRERWESETLETTSLTENFCFDLKVVNHVLVAILLRKKYYVTLVYYEYDEAEQTFKERNALEFAEIGIDEVRKQNKYSLYVGA